MGTSYPGSTVLVILKMQVIVLPAPTLDVILTHPVPSTSSSLSLTPISLTPQKSFGHHFSLICSTYTPVHCTAPLLPFSHYSQHLSLYNIIPPTMQPTLLGLPWRWRQQTASKCCTNLWGITTQNTKYLQWSRVGMFKYVLLWTTASRGSPFLL